MLFQNKIQPILKYKFYKINKVNSEILFLITQLLSQNNNFNILIDIKFKIILKNFYYFNLNQY